MVREDAGARRADLARWGLTRPGSPTCRVRPATRAETLAEQPMFREAFQQRRCLLPANGFYEWRGVRKRPYWVSTGERLLFFAGIWGGLCGAWTDLAQRGPGIPGGRRVRRPLLLDEAEAGYLAGSGRAAATALIKPARQSPSRTCSVAWPASSTSLKPTGRVPDPGLTLDPN